MTVDQPYMTEHHEWRQRLSEGRKGYLALTGLFKLKDPVTTFGSGSDNDYVLAIDGVPAGIGSYTIAEDGLEFKAFGGAQVTSEDGSVVKALDIALNDYGSSAKLFCGNLNWRLITRGGELYIRIWDEENPAIDEFEGFESYPFGEDYISIGTFEYFDNAKSEKVESRLGVTENTNFIGQVTFKMQGEECKLDVGNNGFTMVRDLTSGTETYGGGRYIYLDLPQKDSAVVVDFNRLYNPPCAFSEFTTCLLPPPQNSISFEVLAGERLSE